MVDDGSTDATTAVAEGHGGVVLVRRPHAGAAAARNAGVARATGDLYAFLDADDVWLPGKLAAQVAALEADAGAAGALCLTEEFHSDELGPAARATRPLRPGRHEVRLLSALVVRAAAFARVGPFPEDVPEGGELLDWHLRAADAGLRFVTVPEVLVRRRLHDANTGVRTGAGERANYVRLLKRSLDRRRAAGDAATSP